MLGWKRCRQFLVVLLLLSSASCRPGTDAGIEPAPPLPASALVICSWRQGLGFLVDRDERLVITSAQTVGGTEEAEVIFPTTEEGKTKVRRDYYMKQAPRIAARVIKVDQDHDLAVLQIKSMPDGIQELKLAAGIPPANAPVQTVVDTGSKSTLWSPKSATVVGSSEESILGANDQMVTARVLEVTLENKFAKASGGAALVNESGQLVGVITSCLASKPRVMGIEVTDVRNVLCQAYRNLGSLAFAKADYGKAVTYCDKALALNPDDARTHNERGAALSFLNRYKEAIDDYTTALKLNPKLAQAYRNRGSAHAHLGEALKSKGEDEKSKSEYEQAVADCTKAIEIDDKYVSAYETRKDAYTKLGRAELARKDQEMISELTKKKWSSPDR